MIALPGARIRTAPMFDRYIGIDYSGARTPTTPLPGLRVYAADRRTAPAEVPLPAVVAKYWTRKEIAH